jgi:long-chain fatty acid transport protein
MPIMHTSARSAALALALTASGSVCAGGFAIVTQSGSAVGNAFAGAASAAEDAGTIWYNPAGMTNLQDMWNFSLVANAVKTSFKFQNTGSTGAFAAAGSGEGGDGGAWGPPAQFYAARKLTPNLVAGLAVNTPFGLKTDYDPGWRGRFAAIRSEVKAFNFNPALAYKVTENLSVGAGVSAQYFETELTNVAGAAAGVARLKADDTGWGWNVGALVKVPDTTARIGFAYRSSIN